MNTNRPSRFLIELLEQQGLGEGSSIAMAGGSTVHGIKPMVSGIDTRNFFLNVNGEDRGGITKQINKKRHRKEIDDQTEVLEDETKSYKLQLRSVRNDIQTIVQHRGKRTGICGRCKQKWRKMLATLFNIQRGRALVIDTKAVKENSLYVDESTQIRSIPKTCLTTKPLSQCTAYELGLFLENLLIERSQKDRENHRLR